MSEAKPLWKVKSYDPASRIALASCGVVFVEGEKRQLVCLSAADGSERWSAPTGLLLREGIVVSVDPKGETIIVAEDNAIKAHRASDGQQLWSKVMRASFLDEPEPVWNGDQVLLSAALSTVVAIDRATGERKWEVPGDATQLGARALALGGGSVIAHTYSALAAYDPATGAQRWRYAFSQKHGPGMPRLVASLAASPPTESMLVTLDPGAVVALDTRTGRPMWKHPTSGFASFVVAGKTVLVADGAQVVGLDASTGAERWKVPTGGATWAAPLDAERAFVHLPKKLAIVDYATGKLHEEGGHALGDDDALLAARDGRVVMELDHGASVLRMKDGKLTRTDLHGAGEPVVARVSGATVVVQAKDHTIEALRSE